MSIEGMVDKQTQRAAWMAADETRPLMEAGIGSLAQDSMPVLVHFADGTTQQPLLVSSSNRIDANNRQTPILRMSVGLGSTRRHAVAEHLVDEAGRNDLAISLLPNAGSDD